MIIVKKAVIFCLTVGTLLVLWQAVTEEEYTEESPKQQKLHNSFCDKPEPS
jgi:hypothetical protein